MVNRAQVRHAIVLASIWLRFSIGSAFAHGGHEHASGPDASSVWLGAASVVVLGALVYSLVRRRDPEPAGELGERGSLEDTDRDG